MVVSASDEFKNLFEKKYNQIEFATGKAINGKVVSVLRDYVIVNIGFKSEGYINIEEFRNLDGEITVQGGEDVQVVIEEIEDDEGNLVLSKEKADAIQAWDHVEKVFKEDGVIDGLVVNKVKGGLSINLGGIKAFLPGSQIDLKPVKSLDKLIGRKFPFKILKLNQEKGNIVLSRRVLLEQERETLKKDILENIKEGQIIRGTVKNITDYGAFIDLGGIDGLLHITDMTWGRVNHPSEILKVNDEVDVAVLKYDAEKEKVSLGFKQLQEDPWEKNVENFHAGEKIKGKVVSLADYGAFIEVMPGIEGLVHVSELSWSKKIKHPNKLLKVGDMVEALILDVDKDNRKMALGLKQLEPNPWDILHQKYPLGSKVMGKIRNITDFGIFVGVDEEEIDGLVHVSDISWDKSYKWPNEDFKKGQDIEVTVLNIDRENKKFSLGIKQLSDNPFALMMRAFPLGTEVNGKIEEVSDKGIVFRIDDKTVGFVPAAEAGVQKSKIKEHFNAGDTISAQVKKYDDRERRMIASIKSLESKHEKDNMKEFLNKQGDASVTLQDIMK
jgi:small subunit ribosomal protein S1